MSDLYDANVVIVGIDPCGSYLAHLLASYGVEKIIVLEKGETPCLAPQAAVWDDYTLRSATSAGGRDLDVYMRWHAGVLDDLSHKHGHLSGIRCGPPEMRRSLLCACCEWGARAQPKQMASQPYARSSFHQLTWETEMFKRLSCRTGVCVCQCAEVVHVSPMNGSCSVTVNLSGTSETRAITTRFCIVTDGDANDIVGKLGLHHDTSTVSHQQWIIVDCEIDDEEYLRTSWLGNEGNGIVVGESCPFVFIRTPAFFGDWWNDASNRPTGMSYYFDTAEEHAMAWKEIALNQKLASYMEAPTHSSSVPKGLGCRFEFPLSPGTSVQTATSDAHINHLLRDICHVNPDRMCLIHKSVHTYHTHCKDKWYDRSVVLAGDAAHGRPPFEGLDLGLHDAVNLAWKLALILKGKAGESILVSYEAERKACFEQLVQHSMELGKFVTTGHTSSDAVAGKMTSSFPHVCTDNAFRSLLGSQPLAGQLFPCPHVQCGEQSISLDNLIAPNGFTLIFCGGQINASADEWMLLSKIKAQVVFVASSKAGVDIECDLNRESLAQGLRCTTCCDVEGYWTQWVAENKIDGLIVLVRPDKYIFGVFHDVESAEASLDAALCGSKAPRACM